jgi:long-subunit acyl-CoA synthetase (AMP-forming)
LVAHDKGAFEVVRESSAVALAAGTATVCTLFQQTASRHREGPAIGTLDGSALSWEDYNAQIRDTAGALAGLGLARGDVMACWLTNRPEFHVADAAAMHLGLTSFSVFNTSTRDQAEHVLGDAGAKVLVTEAAYVDAAIAIRDGGRTPLEHIVLVDGDAPQALGWDELLEFGRADFDFDAAWQAVQPDDVATLIYTSGTTGPPKGVELTHANITAQTLALFDRLRLSEGMRTVSFLPLAHAAERLGAHYLPMFGGWEITCCPATRATAQAIAEVQPEYIFSPPRLWEKLRATIVGGAGATERAELDAAMERVRAGDGPQDGSVQQAARRRVGLGAVEVALIGAAPCPAELLVFWHACGVPLSELYGLSECAGVATVARPDEARVGTAGPAHDACEIRLADDGEILIRGPVVMRGYRNLTDMTAEAIDADGWLHSGDVGELDEDGHLRVIDRVATIEAELLTGVQLIGQACVISDARPYTVALLTLEPDAARAYAQRCGVPHADLGRLSRSRRIVEAVQAEVMAVNRRLAGPHRISRFLLLGVEWPPGGDELTPTMKVKRRPIADKYASEIDALYSGAVGIEP